MTTTTKNQSELTKAEPGTAVTETPLPPRLIDGARDFIIASRSETTRLAYAKAWAAFKAR